MGGQISKMMGKIFGSKEMRLLMLGLDAAGKTSMCLPSASLFLVFLFSFLLPVPPLAT
jgi:hypothetical protein